MELLNGVSCALVYLKGGLRVMNMHEENKAYLIRLAFPMFVCLGLW